MSESGRGADEGPERGPGEWPREYPPTKHTPRCVLGCVVRTFPGSRKRCCGPSPGVRPCGERDDEGSEVYPNYCHIFLDGRS